MYHLTISRAGRKVAEVLANVDLANGDGIDRVVARVVADRRRVPVEECTVEIRALETTIKPGKLVGTYIPGGGLDG